MPPHSDSILPEAETLRLLKDGYWAVTSVIRRPDGSLRVRKEHKPSSVDAIWELESLRREIRYLDALPSDVAADFPPVLASWDFLGADGEIVAGYDLPFYPDHEDLGAIARRSGLAQPQIDHIQQMIADALFGRVHQPVPDAAPLSVHVRAAVGDALRGLCRDEAMRPLVEAATINLNGKSVSGPAAVWQKIEACSGALESLDAVEAVRLHGDCFLENILWSSGEGTPRPLVLIDPVSVAGVVAGPPVFDLVKYVSYASGELLALRSEWIEAERTAADEYVYRIRWDDTGLRPFRDRDWFTLLRAEFEKHRGPIDRRHYHLIDGYFSVAMALNTQGRQRLGRLLKAVQDFDAVLALS